MPTVALFVPCYVDQLYPRVAVAALGLLERLGFDVQVPEAAACCGQPAANAGYAHDGDAALARVVEAYADCERVVVLSGSCAAHVRAHAGGLGGGLGSRGARVAARAVEFCAFLHDEVGVEAIGALGARFPHRVALHVGCHALRGLGLARPSEIQLPPFDKLRALLGAVRGLTVAELRRPDECCGFGGTFAVAEPAVSAKMGRDRLRDYAGGGAEAVVSTDVSCLMHLGGLAHRAGARLPMLHAAEVLAGVTIVGAAPAPAVGATGARA
jgi:L-lactate dehydrogenase complex protein LldE